MDDYPPADGRRKKLLAHFNVPEFVANRTCFELNGYFGNKATYDDKSEKKHVTSYSKHPTSSASTIAYWSSRQLSGGLTDIATWFRCLVKMIKKVDDDPHEPGPEYVVGKKDYKWFEMSFFTRWDSPNMSQVLCVDTPPDFPIELKKLLDNRPQLVDFRDPFAMHANLVDQIVVYTDISVWRVRDPVRQLEKVSSDSSPIPLLTRRPFSSPVPSLVSYAHRCHLWAHS